MLRKLIHALALESMYARRKRNRVLELIPLEDRRLLSSGMDLTTTATVTTITNSVAAVQPLKSTYAVNADSVRIDFTAQDPDDSGPTPTTHFRVTDPTSNTVIISNGTGNSLALSEQGIYSVQFWSTDADDSEAVGANSILVAIDRKSPSISLNPTSPEILWPPNGKSTTVTVTGTAFDRVSGVDPSTLRFHVVDEYGRVQPAGLIKSVTESSRTLVGGFEQVRFSFQVSLQARRNGFDFDGRRYTIDVSARDVAGNWDTSAVTVTVPHDRGHRGGNPNGRHPGDHQPTGRFNSGNLSKQGRGRGNGRWSGNKHSQSVAAPIGGSGFAIGWLNDYRYAHGENGHGRGQGHDHKHGKN